jgi:ABC-2 type transport system ATP-binding protein
MAAGRLLRSSTLAELRAEAGVGSRVLTPHLARLVDILDAAGHTHQPTGDDLVTDATPEEVGELAAAHGVVLHGLVGTSDLEHAFFQLIHTAADDDSGPRAREMIT